MKKIKRNILRSFLFVCLGLAFTTIVFASVKISGDVPSAPGRPMILDVWPDGCMLSYTSSIRNGGSPVLNYIIEYKDQWYSQWKIVGKTTVLIYRVNNMREGSTAEFRVSAVNKFGISEPSPASERVKFE